VRLIATLILLLAASSVYGQCGPNGCPVPSYSWKEHPDDPGRIYLYQGNIQVGGWDYDTHTWRDLTSRGWGQAKSTPLIAPPERILPANFGVDSIQLRKSRWEINGKEVSKDEVDSAISQPPNIPDHTKKFRLTCNLAQRNQIQKDWYAFDPELAKRVVFWAVPADHWSQKDEAGVGFAPGLTFQSPDGKVLHRQVDYAGPEDFQAIRKAVKAYDSSKDPDLRKEPVVPVPPAPVPFPIVPPAPSTPTVPPWLALLGLVSAYLYKKRN